MGGEALRVTIKNFVAAAELVKQDAEAGTF